MRGPYELVTSFGMTLIAVTIVIIIAKSRMSPPAAVLSSMIVGASICLAISQASDMMLDLKSGYLVGAIPRRQQLAQFIGVWLGPFIVVFLMLLLNHQYKIGSDKLPAPQATALASIIDGIMNDNVPAYRYVAGSGAWAITRVQWTWRHRGTGGAWILHALQHRSHLHHRERAKDRFRQNDGQEIRP